MLPEQGLKNATIIRAPDQSFQRFYNSIEDLADAIQRIDERETGKSAVYFGCAGYADRRRTKGSVQSVKSFWLDIDCGDGKPYGSVQAGLGAVEDFCGRNDLPAPVLVSSGTGLHVYWPLQSELDRGTWEAYATGLKDFCAVEGLQAGRERTADCASILRPPGTLHRKGSPRPVVCGPLRGPYPIALFEKFLNHAPRSIEPPRKVNGHHLNLPGYLRGHGHGLLRHLDLGGIHAPETIDFDALCAGCAQLRNFRDAQGQIPEPLWYAGIGVLAFVAGGEAVGQAWSSGHSTYSQAETAARFSRARALSGPTSCAHFKNLDPDRCKGCRFGSSTPLEAARETSAPQTSRRDRAPPMEDGEVEDGFPSDGPAIQGRPEYEYREGALCFVSSDRKDRPELTTITSYPFELKSIHSGEIKRDQNFYLLRHRHPHDGWREFDLPASALVGREAVSIMADYGVVVHDADHFRRYMRFAADHIRAREKTMMQFEQMGWKDLNTQFLYGDTLYTGEGQQTTAVSQELRYRAQWLKPKPGGSIEGWKDACDNLFGAGSEGLSFTVLASFAAPLMRFLEDNEGGAIVSLVTRHSGAGKTTALAGASSIWAWDPRGLSLTTIDTKVSKGITLGALCNLPLVYDEFSNKDPDVVRDFVLLFTSGRDKMRADSSGQILHAAASWQTILLAASNRSLVDTLTSQNESDAPAFRILEFPVESSSALTIAQAGRLKKQLEENAGWAGQAYLEYIIQPDVLRFVQKQLVTATDEIFAKGGFRKEHRYWVRTLAACAVAATIVHKLGLVSFSPVRILGWAINYFSERAKAEQRDKASLIGVLSAFLNDHIGETLTMPGPSQRGRHIVAPVGEVPRQRVCVRVEIKGERAYVCEPILRKWLQRQAVGYSEFMKELKAKEICLNERKQVTLTAGTELRSGVLPCIEIDWGHPALTGELREVMGGTYKERADAYQEKQREAKLD